MSETAPPPSGPGIFADVMEVAAPIADLPTLFDAELAVSSLLGGAYAAADTNRAQAVAWFTQNLVDYAGGERTPRSRALLAGLAGAAPSEELAATAAAAGAALKTTGPAWVSEAGTVRCTGTWRATDLYADQAQYVATFAYPDQERGGPEHTVCVLVDHNARIAKDLFVAVGTDIVRRWQEAAAEESDILLEAVSADTLRAVVESGMDQADRLEQPPSDSYVEEWAVTRARLALLPTRAEPAAGDEIDQILADFLSSPFAARVAPEAPPGEAVLRACVTAAIEYAVTANSGDPLRWSPTAVDLFLIDWASDHAALDDDAAPWLPEVLSAFVQYAGQRRGLPEQAVTATIRAIADAAPHYTDAILGLEAPVQELLRRMVADGVDPTDQDEVAEWVIAYRAAQERAARDHRDTPPVD